MAAQLHPTLTIASTSTSTSTYFCQIGDPYAVSQQVQHIFEEYVRPPVGVQRVEDPNPLLPIGELTASSPSASLEEGYGVFKGTEFTPQAVKASITKAAESGHGMRHVYDGMLPHCLQVLEGCLSEFISSIHYSYVTDLLRKQHARITIDDFQPQAKLGEGGFGTVSEVIKRDTGKRYAMKAMRKVKLIKAYGEEVWDALAEQERLILGKLHHPLIVNLAYAFQNIEYLWLVMDACDGGDLEMFAVNGAHRMTEAQVRFVGLQMVALLTYLHNTSCLYRDLKPENVLLDSAGQCRLVDFGTAKLSKKVGAKQPPASSELCGSRPFMAPEVEAIGKLMDDGRDDEVMPYSSACDWFSLGVTLYVLAEKAYPFGLHPAYEDVSTEFVQPTLLADDRVTEVAHLYDLLTGLLDWDPLNRFGGDAERIEALRAHPYWLDADWELADAGLMPSPLRQFAEQQSEHSTDQRKRDEV